jgi:chromosome segregation protein
VAIGIAKEYKNRFKIVTLDGQVINAGGSMAGGSAAKGAGILSRANMIEELQKEAEKLSKEAEKATAEFKSALEEANRAAAEMQAAEADMLTAKEDIIRAQGEDKLLEDRLLTLNSQRSALVSEKENADGRIILFKKEFEENEALSADIQKQLSLRMKASKASGDALGACSEARALRTKEEEINLTSYPSQGY